MLPTLSVPITTQPEALDFIKREGLEEVFEKALVYVAQTATEAKSIRVVLEYDHNAACLCAMIEVVLSEGDPSEQKLRELFFDWISLNLPRESFFSLAIYVTWE